MKKIVIILVILFIACPLYAKEYKFNKKCNPAQLAEELQTAGINLLGKDQIGYMETTNEKDIRVVLKDGVVIDESKLNTIISAHVPRDYVAERKAKEDKTISKLKSLGLTDEEIGVLIRR